MSTPAQQFRQNLNGIRRIIDMDKSSDGPVVGVPKPNRRRAVEELRAACCILPVAYFEDFLRCLIAYFVDKLCAYRPQVPWAALPDRLRLAVAHNSVRVMATWDADDDLAVTEARMFAIFEQLASPANATERYALPSEVIRLTRSNPNGGTVCDLMQLIGVVNLFNQIAACLPSLIPPSHARLYSARLTYSNPAAVKRKLDDIVAERNRTAHGGLGAAKTRDDIIEQIDFLEHFSEALQSVVRAHQMALGALRK